ncbi:CDP-diacylglycerol diphosphatase [Methylobacterium nigriterrae]|uniref:CDP-diacylglycerol diphosphatase n=1 Tax=Methylobacterium nigriterrae TaxID=3127512 RepID=UPI0030133619
MRALLLSLLLATLATAAAAAISRDMLWVVTSSCVTAKRVVGRPFPCLDVRLGSDGEPGFVVLRAPPARTEVVVVPTDRIAGLEVEALRAAPGAAYWQAALAARHYVTDALKGGLALADVAMAVNSQGGRTQDQLHIHLDCVQPAVREALRMHAASFGPAWAPLPFSLAGKRYFGLRIGAEAASRFNPFESLARLPGPAGLRRTSLAVVSTPPGSADPGFFVLAHRAPYSEAETLLDHDCAIAADGAGR